MTACGKKPLLCLVVLAHIPLKPLLGEKKFKYVVASVQGVKGDFFPCLFNCWVLTNLLMPQSVRCKFLEAALMD